MENKLNMEELTNKLKNLYIESYNALFKNNDYKSSNKFVNEYVQIEMQLVLSSQGIKSMKSLLDDENEIVRYYASVALVSVFPKKCIKILKDVEKGDLFLAIEVKYVLNNYFQNNNYIQKFLAENKH